MKILDNVNSTVRDDLQETTKKGSKVSKINVGEIFKMLAPDTRIKVI